MTVTDPREADEQIALMQGRRAPFTMVGDWVYLSGVSNAARSLFWGMAGHVSQSRDDNEVWPSLRTLARFLGLKKAEQVMPYMVELEVIGAIETVRTQVGLTRRNRYMVHATPPKGWTLPESFGAYYNLNRGTDDETQEQRDARDAEFDAWLESVRGYVKELCTKVMSDRKGARKSKLPLPELPAFNPPQFTPSKTADRSKTAGQAAPQNTGVRTPKNGGQAPPKMGVERDEDQPHVPEQDDAAPAARSAPDARRASTGSSARETKGGSAASGGAKAPKKSPAKKTGRNLTKYEAEQIRAIEAAYPSELRELMPKYRPPVLRDAMLSALALGTSSCRTGAELGARVDRRWYTWGFARKADTQTGGEGLKSAVGALVSLLGHTDCPNPRCEDGTIIDDAQPCEACVQRKADRRAAHRAGKNPVPAQRSGQSAEPMWECYECRDPAKGTAPDDGLCKTCRTEARAAADAVAALEARWSQEREDAERAGQLKLLDEAYAEHAEREQSAAEAREAAAAAAERRRREAEETERLRAQVAAENPELLQYAQNAQ